MLVVTVLPARVGGHVHRAVLRHQRAAAASARRRQRREGSRRSRAGSPAGRRPGDSARSVSRSAVRPGEARRPDGRRRQPGLRQGNPQRNFQPGHADAAPGDSGEHAPGDSAHGRLPVLAARLGAVVHQLRRDVQHARRAGVFRRQRHQRAGTRNARPAAHDDHHAVANPVGQADRRPARLERADAVSAVAAVAGLHHADVLLPEHAPHRGPELPRDHRRPPHRGAAQPAPRGRSRPAVRPGRVRPGRTGRGSSWRSTTGCATPPCSGPRSAPTWG